MGAGKCNCDCEARSLAAAAAINDVTGETLPEHIPELITSFIPTKHLALCTIDKVPDPLQDFPVIMTNLAAMAQNPNQCYRNESGLPLLDGWVEMVKDGVKWWYHKDG